MREGEGGSPERDGAAAEGLGQAYYEVGMYENPKITMINQVR